MLEILQDHMERHLHTRKFEMEFNLVDFDTTAYIHTYVCDIQTDNIVNINYICVYVKCALFGLEILL